MAVQPIATPRVNVANSTNGMYRKSGHSVEWHLQLIPPMPHFILPAIFGIEITFRFRVFTTLLSQCQRQCRRWLGPLAGAH